MQTTWQESSGGHLVASIFPIEGVEAIFSAFGRSIDVYARCAGEQLLSSTFGMSEMSQAAVGYARTIGNMECVVVSAGPETFNATARTKRCANSLERRSRW